MFVRFSSAVLDDDRDFVTGLAALIEQMGHEPSVAYNCKTARAMAGSLLAYSTQIEQPYHGKASRHSTRTRAEIPQQSKRCGRGDAG